MTSHPLSGDYLRWLAPQIRGEDDRNPRRTYEDLVVLMFEKEFPEKAAELVPNDSNRIGDGLDLRVDFCREHGMDTHCLQDLGPCSFLEVLIGLSRRLAFNAPGGNNPPRWSWILMNNLVLHRITDPVARGKARRADDIMETCIWRTYSPDGSGGFFPLKHPSEDQTQVEVWYQMSAYIREMPEGW